MIHKCIFTSLHVAPDALRPWFRNVEDGLRAEHKSLRRLLASLARARTVPRVYTLVRRENESTLWGLATTPVHVRTSHPLWAYEWHRQSFVKLAVPRAARTAGCDRVLFLDNDCRVLRNIDRLFDDVEPPAFAWHKQRLNSGVMLLPTDDDFITSLGAYVSRQYRDRSVPRRLRDGSDQELFQGFFADEHRRVYELPSSYNARKATHQHDYAANVSIAHFVHGDGPDFVPRQRLEAPLKDGEGPPPISARRSRVR